METGADIKLSAIRLLYTCIECLWMDFKFREIWKHWSLEKTGSSYEHKFVSSDNIPHHILRKVKKKISEIGQDQKNLRSTFVSFFNVSAEGGGNCKLGSLPNKIINFSGVS